MADSSRPVVQRERKKNANCVIPSLLIFIVSLFAGGLSRCRFADSIVAVSLVEQLLFVGLSRACLDMGIGC